MKPVFSFDVVLPTRGQGTVKQSLYQQLRSAILDGRVAPGTKLPATRQVATGLGVARNTVLAAYDLLIAEGYVIPRAGAKAVVADVTARRSRPVRRSSAAVIANPRMNPLWLTPALKRETRRKLPERSFRLGTPEYRFFPHDTWRRLSARSLRSFAKRPFTYSPSEGVPELRAAIAHHVAFARAVACTADDVIVTSGAQQAFDMLARLLVVPGRTKVAVENPGYPPLRSAFLAAGAELVPIGLDDEGMRVADLPDDVNVVSVTPSHQSPTGAVLSLQRRTELLDFARRRGAVVIEDDYDGEFRYGGRPLDALQMMDRDGSVFYVGTFSKSLFPALRKGFIVAPPWACDGLINIKYASDAHSDATTQSLLAAFIHDGHLARYVQRMNKVYAARWSTLLEELARLDSWLQPIPSEAGLHLAARIVDPGLASTVISLAQEHLPGTQSTMAYSRTPLKHQALTVGYGVVETNEIAAAFKGFRRALASAKVRTR
ncbi:MAG: PLP-dependent aminotransferase family protein [Steroidobacter sp.]